jgi:hypothetical protein
MNTKCDYTHVNNIDDPKKFKVVLQKFLYENSFYSLDEYFKPQKKLIYYYILLEQTYERLDMHALICLYI